MISQDYLKEREEIASKLKLDSPEKIEAAFQYGRQLYLIEENRKDRIESRANLLIASSAIVMALVTVFLCIILYLAPDIPLLLIIIILIAYAFFALFIFNTINYALSISKLKGYSVTMPDSFESNDLKQTDIGDIRKSLAIDYCCLATKHRDINDQKGILLNTSQKLLKNAVIILILLSLAFVVDILLSNKIHMKYLAKLKSWFDN
jgi:small-conductance mechanosensitive channel